MNVVRVSEQKENAQKWYGAREPCTKIHGGRISEQKQNPKKAVGVAIPNRKKMQKKALGSRFQTE